MVILYTNLADRPSTFPADMTNIYNKTECDNRFLNLTGGTISGILNINTELKVTTSVNYNQIKSKTTTSGTYASMSFENNNAKFGYIGVAGTAITGYYANNLYLEANNSLIFNSGGQQSGSIPRMIINNDGNIGIGTSNPGTNKLYVNGTTFLNNNTTINGTCTATTFSGSGASLTSVPHASITGLPATFPPTMTNIYTKTETVLLP